MKISEARGAADSRIITVEVLGNVTTLDSRCLTKPLDDLTVPIFSVLWQRMTISLVNVERIYFAARLKSSSHSKRLIDWAKAIHAAVKDKDRDGDLVSPVHRRPIAVQVRRSSRVTGPHLGPTVVPRVAVHKFRPIPAQRSRSEAPAITTAARMAGRFGYFR